MTKKEDAYLEQARAVAEEVRGWPDWKKAGFRLPSAPKPEKGRVVTPMAEVKDPTTPVFFSLLIDGGEEP